MRCRETLQGIDFGVDEAELIGSYIARSARRTVHSLHVMIPQRCGQCCILCARGFEKVIRQRRQRWRAREREVGLGKDCGYLTGKLGEARGRFAALALCLRAGLRFKGRRKDG